MVFARVTFAQVHRDVHTRVTFKQPLSVSKPETAVREVSTLCFGFGQGGYKSVPHAATHRFGGTDPITPESIGAAAKKHTHYASDIEGLGFGGGGGSDVDMDELKRLFHPKYGGSTMDFTTKDLTANDVNAHDITANDLTVHDIAAHDLTANDMWARIGRLRDLFASGSVGSADFMAGLLGTGWNISAAGNGEMESLILRTFLSTPELVKNKIRVIGSEAWLTENGVVAAVRENPFLATGLTTATGQRLGTRWTGDYFVSFHDENSNKWFRYDDILRGIYNFDDGFRTVYLRVVRELGNGYILRPLNGLAPTAEMVLARQGNFSDPARQGSIYLNSAEAYIRVLGGMNSTAIVKDNLMAQLGSLENLREFGISDMPKVGIYTRAGVFKGLGAADVGADPAGTAQALKNQLKGLAYKEMVETAQLGSTVIQGGYIKTDLINAQAIAVQEAFITKLLAQEAFINQLATNTAFINSLVARTIKTNTDGRRVEIDPVVSSVELYDQYGRQVVMLYDGSGGDGYDAKAKVINPLKRSIFGELLSDRVVFRDLSLDGAYGAFSYNGIKLPSTASINMPGVLAGYSVKGSRSVAYSWGAKISTKTIEKLGTGRYRVPHEIGHTHYLCSATAHASANGGWVGTASLLGGHDGIHANSVDIIVTDMNGEPRDEGFELILTGVN